MGQREMTFLDKKELRKFAIHVTFTKNKTSKKIKFLVILQKNKTEKQKCTYTKKMINDISKTYS